MGLDGEFKERTESGEPLPNRTLVTGRFETFTSANVVGRGGRSLRGGAGEDRVRHNSRTSRR